MMRQEFSGKLLLFCWLPLLALIIPSLACGAEFSAQMVVKDGPKILPGKIYVSDGKMRQEFIDERGQTVTIVRPDKKVVWVLIPPNQSYLEMPLKSKLPGQFMQIPPGVKRQVGKENIGGYETDKYQITVPGDQKCETQTYWVAQKLGMPIKMECGQSQFSMEYKGIKEEKIPEKLFELPPGFQKTTTPHDFDKTIN